MMWTVQPFNSDQFTEGVLAAIPKLKYVGIAALLVVITFLLLRPNKNRSLWLRNTMIVLGICLALPAGLSIFNAGRSLIDTDPPRALISPDGTRVADYSHEVSFLGRDSTRVTVRLPKSMNTEEAYFGPGTSEGTTVRWLDNHDLEISYLPAPEGRTQQCNSEAAGVKIHCKLLAPNSLPTPTPPPAPASPSGNSPHVHPHSTPATPPRP